MTENHNTPVLNIIINFDFYSKFLLNNNNILERTEIFLSNFRIFFLYLMFYKQY